MMKTLFLAAAIGLAVSPSVAFAQQRPAGTYMVVIPVHDLNLATPAGASVLRERASLAAADVCLENVRPLRSRHGVNACRDRFMAKVERRIELASRQQPLLASR